MREITRSVKVALKCLIAVVLVDVDLPYWTSNVEHLVPFAAIVSNICTAHAQKRLFMNFRCRFRHRRFPIWVQNCCDLVTFYVDFCILYSECPPYFYFRFVWPTEVESIPHASIPTSIIATKFEVDMTIHCRVVRVQNFGDLATFSVEFCILYVDVDSHVNNSHQVWNPYADPFLSYEWQRFPLVTIENANAATAYAPNHVTRE